MSRKKATKEIKIGLRLRELREELGKTQEEVAKSIGITKKSISCYENNLTMPPVEILEKMARYFGKSMDYLVSGVETEYKDVKISDKKLLNLFEKMDMLELSLKKPMEIVIEGYISGCNKRK
jgi:transcriptional regulator with XRE-family HTH domain